MEDLEWAADIGCSRCQFSARGCRTCLFRIIESCYEKDQEIPPMIADLAQRFRPWPEPPAAAVTEEEHKARAEDAERRRVEKEHEDRQREQSEAKPLAWLPPTLSAVAFRLYGLDANVAYKEGAKPARESLPNYKYIIWPCQQLPPPINGSPSAALVGPESGCHWDLPRPYITEVRASPRLLGALRCAWGMR